MDARGELGEAIARERLELRGYVILDRNVRCRGGELDIIARHEGDLVFIEVKTRSSQSYGGGAEAVTATKATHMARAAQEYITRHGLHNASMRCDVVCVILNDQMDPAVEILRDAVALGDYL